MNKYRVYAKIIGYSLPKNENLVLFNCTIRKMSLNEQKIRKFKPIELDFRDIGDNKFHKSFITKKVFSDPRFIKTNYVIYCDVNIHDENGALGLATRLFDRVSGSLALTTSSFFNKKNNRTDYLNYEYQLCKVYELEADGKEKLIDNPRINGGGWGMINQPGHKNFQELDLNLLGRMLNCRDEIFNKAFKYLLKAEKEYHLHVPPQMLTINLFKSIEIIIESFKGKNFNNKLKKSKDILGLNTEDTKKIKELRYIRNYGDVAHPRSGSRTISYPPQFPVPEDVDYLTFWYSGLAGKVLLGYFLYIDSILNIKITTDKYDPIDEIVSVNYGEFYEFNSSINDKKKLPFILKKKLSEYFNIPCKNIRLYKKDSDSYTFKILNHLKYDLKPPKNSKQSLIIFPSKKINW